MPSSGKDAVRFGCPREHMKQDGTKSQQNEGYIENLKDKVQSAACGKSVSDLEEQVLSRVEEDVNGVKDNLASTLATPRKSLENMAESVQSKIIGSQPNKGRFSPLYTMPTYCFC